MHKIRQDALFFTEASLPLLAIAGRVKRRRCSFHPGLASFTGREKLFPLSVGYLNLNGLQGKHKPKQQNPTLLSNSQATTPHTEIAPQAPRPQNNHKKDGLIYYAILKVLLAELGRPQNGHFLKALRSILSKAPLWNYGASSRRRAVRP